MWGGEGGGVSECLLVNARVSVCARARACVCASHVHSF